MRMLLGAIALFLSNCIGILPTGVPVPDADLSRLVPAVCGEPAADAQGLPWSAPTRVVLPPSELQAAGFDAAGYPLATPDRGVISNWLIEGDVESLDSSLGGLRIAAREDLRREIWLFDAYEVFDEAVEEVGVGVDHWLAQKPDSLAALEAAALFSEASGWSRRGRKYAEETSAESFAEMRRAFERAERLARRVLEKDPGSLVATKILVRMAKAGGGSSLDRTDVLIEAAGVSRSRFIRATQLHGLAPRWGGSHAEMRQVIEGVSDDFVSHPELRSLCGFIVWDAARSWPEDQPEEAARIADAARQHGEVSQYATTAAALYRLAGDPVRALAIANETLAVHPQSREVLDRKAHAALEVGRVEEALGACRTLDHMNARSRFAQTCWRSTAGYTAARGHGAFREEDFSAAIEDYTTSLGIDGRQSEVVYWRGRAYERIGLVRKALADYRQAIGLDPDRLETYNQMAEVLRRLGRMEEMSELAEQYVERHPDDPNGLAHRGSVRFFSGDFARGIADLRRACQQGSEHGCENLRQAGS